MNRQQLLSRLARRGWPLVYSTGALSLWDRETPAWQKAPWLPDMEPHDGVWIDSPGRLTARWPKVPWLDCLATKAHARNLLRRAAPRVGADGIGYLFRPRFLPYVDALRSRYLVYHAYDVFSLTPEWTDKFAAMERAVVARADLIIGTTQDILDRLPPGGRAPRQLLPNGVDASAFAVGSSYPVPPDLAAIPQPRIGYVGRINRKVDFALVAAIAQQRPSWHWVFVGPVQDGGGAPDLDAANQPGFAISKSLPNVHFLGCKPRQDLPAYMGHIDVNVMCYRQGGGWWIGIHPLKLYEYLAVGRPVISTPLQSIQCERHVVDIVSGVDEWIAAIERALAGHGTGTLAARRAAAFANSWRKRVDQLDLWLREMLAQPPTSEPVS